MTRGRPRKFDEAAALEVAMNTFWRHGYQATTLDHLLQATGMNRASLYATFGDKRQLFLKALDLYLAKFELRASGAGEAAGSAREAVISLLDASVLRLSDPAFPPGCLRINTTLEHRGSDANLGTHLNAANMRFEQAAAAMLKALQKKGRLPEGEDPDVLGRLYASILAGLVVLSQSGASREALQEIVKVATRAFPGPEGLSAS